MKTIEEAYGKASSGDLTNVVSLLDLLDHDGAAEARAWSLAFRALTSLLAPSLSPTPSPAEVDAEISGVSGTRDILSRACNHCALGHLLRFDRAGLERWRGVAQQLGGVPGQGLETSGRTSVEAWCSLLDGDGASAQHLASHLSFTASEAQEPALLIEATSLRALSALSQGRLPEAIDIARTGSRMARTEELLVHEYLANIVLARVRRYSRRSYLSQRILDSLASVVPEPWFQWVSWELILAGVPMHAKALLSTRRSHLHEGVDDAGVDHAIRLLDAAVTGETACAFDEALALETSVAGWHDIGVEARTFVAALLPKRFPSDIDRSTNAWLSGETDVVPAVIHGLCIPDIDVDGGCLPAVVVVCGQEGARRILSRGLPLIHPAASEWIPELSLALGRAHTAIATLALVGAGGLAPEELFQKVYGFEFVHSKHTGVLRTLLYRIRKEIDGRGRLLRRGSNFVLEPIDVLVTPEPRGVPEIEDLILRNLSTSGGRASARTTAKTLGVPLRTVQAAMRRLVDDGICTVQREGRHIEYNLEDTTFAEPTLHRMAPRGDP